MGEYKHMHTYVKVAIVLLLIILTKTGNVMSAGPNSFNITNNIKPATETNNLTVEYKDNNISIRAQDVSVKTITEEIVKVSGIKGWVFGDNSEKISIELHNVSLQKALKKVLKNKSYGFVYNQAGEGEGVLKVLEIKKRPMTSFEDIARSNNPFANKNLASKVKPKKSKKTKKSKKSKKTIDASGLFKKAAQMGRE